MCANVDCRMRITSSLLELRLSTARGLLGVLLAAGASSGAEPDWGEGDMASV